MTKNHFRLAHLSDLHFSEMGLDIQQFFSKRWIGNLNYLLRRKKEFDHEILDSIPLLLKEQGVQLVLLSGDLSCTSSKAEFSKAAAFIEKLKSAGLEVVILPGNHDHYTKKAYREKLFYKFFPSTYGTQKWDLKEQGVALKHLFEQWWLVLLDTTLATPLLCSHGRFSESAEHHLKEALSSLPANSQVILANHFPIMCKKLRPALQRRKALFDVLKQHPQVRFYLHGHNHKHTILDLREEGLPVTVDAGSATLKASGSFTLMDCGENTCSFQPFVWNIKTRDWTPAPKKTSFTWV
jgi:3',5'-cyclic AMP phosphodiesterase CpdA